MANVDQLMIGSLLKAGMWSEALEIRYKKVKRQRISQSHHTCCLDWQTVAR